MGFQPLDPELEEVLSKLIEAADAEGWSPYCRISESAEYRELKRLGMFDDTREYIDGDGMVLLSYAARKYFDRKNRSGSSNNTSNRAASIVGTFVGSAVKEFISE